MQLDFWLLKFRRLLILARVYSIWRLLFKVHLGLLLCSGVNFWFRREIPSLLKLAHVFVNFRGFSAHLSNHSRSLCRAAHPSGLLAAPPFLVSSVNVLRRHLPLQPSHWGALNDEEGSACQSIIPSLIPSGEDRAITSGISLYCHEKC